LRIALALLLAVAPAFAQDGEIVSSSRNAKHLITPFVGYQALNGEERGLSYAVDINDPSFPDTTFHFAGSFKGERNANPPVLGIAYRYLATPKMQVEGTFSFLQDKTDFEYPVVLDFYGFRQQRNIAVHRTNMTALNLDGLYFHSFQEPFSWLGGAARLGVGYAWRDITTSWVFNAVSGVNSAIDVKDADQLFSVRAGCDLFFYKTDNLVFQGGMSYAQYFPMGSDLSSFGGFGWRVSVFPIWSASPGE